MQLVAYTAAIGQIGIGLHVFGLAVHWYDQLRFNPRKHLSQFVCRRVSAGVDR